jgi:hypothetical protein
MTPKQFCEKYFDNEINYTINPDKTIDVNGNVDLDYKLGNMKKLPVKFGKVSCDFDCYGNNLTTLEGCPYYVGKSFWCHGNKLTSLKYCPSYISLNFYSDIITHHVLGNIHHDIFYIKQRIVI